MANKRTTSKAKGRKPAAAATSFEEEPLEIQIDVGRSEARKLTKQLNSALNTFELVKRAIDSTLRAGVTTIDQETKDAFPWFDNTLSEVTVKSLLFSAILETTFSKPVVPAAHPPSKIDPDSDRATIVRELLAALSALDQSTQAISKASAGVERDEYIDGMCRASSILHRLLKPLLAGDVNAVN